MSARSVAQYGPGRPMAVSTMVMPSSGCNGVFLSGLLHGKSPHISLSHDRRPFSDERQFASCQDAMTSPMSADLRGKKIPTPQTWSLFYHTSGQFTTAF